jgi:electron transfer flavoprotein alpha subunit
MVNIGILIESGEEGIKETNFGVITAAGRKSGGNLLAFIINGNAPAAKAALEAYGVQKVVGVTAPASDFGARPELQAAALAAAVKHFDIVGLLGLASLEGRDMLARVAAILDAPLVQDCLNVNLEAGTVTKSHFSGRTTATLRLKGIPLICSLRPNSVEPVCAPAAATVENFQAPSADPGRIQIKAVKKAGGGAVDLPEASIIITGGRPIGASENYQMLRECAAALGAAVGASRAAVDAGYAPHSMQVGQTGKTVSPKLYIACGVSGAVQHFAGMKTSKVIVAINNDKDAPIFGKSNYGILGDMFEVVPVLTELIKKRRQQS